MGELVTGIVKQNWDEDHKNMAQVEYYLGEAGVMETAWMPVMMPYGGPDYGAYLFPEVGAEVVVGFRFDDKDRPFILGSILGNVNTVPEGNATENNTVRMLKTKGGFKISVDEEQNLISFTDPEGQNLLTWSTEKDHGHLTLDIKEKLDVRIGGEPFLTMEKEKVTFGGKVAIADAEEMSLKAEKMILEAEKDLTVKCGQAMTLNTDQKLVMKGQNIEITPDQGLKVAGMKADIAPSQQINIKSVQLKLEGTTAALSAKASMKVESTGIMEVKGAMVKLN